MTQFLYNLLFPFAFLALLPGYLLRIIRRGGYRHKFTQRFARYSKATRSRFVAMQKQTTCLTWVHAVSVGEIHVALKLAKKWKVSEPDLQMILSTTTSTGFAIANQKAPEWMEAIYNPIDFLPFVSRALKLIHPQRIIFIEAEVWPNFSWIAKRRGIPMALVNARLSPRSAKRFATFKKWTTPIFQRLSLICVQEPSDIAVWESLGVEHRILQCVGSIKFDYEEELLPDSAVFQSLLITLGVDKDMPILLGGSTHDGEEMILANVYRHLKKQDQALLLIIAPRHVERCHSIESELLEKKFTVIRRSQLSKDRQQPLPDILLLDTTGELAQWYPLATVVFIGKSLTATGGQNPVEAVAAERPVLFGPHMENFAVIAQSLLKYGAAYQVNTVAEMEERIQFLLENSEARKAMQTGARSALAPHQGATQRTVTLLRTLLS